MLVKEVGELLSNIEALETQSSHLLSEKSSNVMQAWHGNTSDGTTGHCVVRAPNTLQIMYMLSLFIFLSKGCVIPLDVASKIKRKHMLLINFSLGCTSNRHFATD